MILYAGLFLDPIACTIIEACELLRSTFKTTQVSPSLNGEQMLKKDVHGVGPLLVHD